MWLGWSKGGKGGLRRARIHRYTEGTGGLGRQHLLFAHNYQVLHARPVTGRRQAGEQERGCKIPRLRARGRASLHIQRGMCVYSAHATQHTLQGPWLVPRMRCLCAPRAAARRCRCSGLAACGRSSTISSLGTWAAPAAAWRPAAAARCEPAGACCAAPGCCDMPGGRCGCCCCFCCWDGRAAGPAPPPPAAALPASPLVPAPSGCALVRARAGILARSENSSKASSLDR